MPIVPWFTWGMWPWELTLPGPIAGENRSTMKTNQQPADVRRAIWHAATAALKQIRLQLQPSQEFVAKFVWVEHITMPIGDDF